MQREFAKRNVIPNASYPLYASKEGSLDYLGPVWYMCLKTENCCLKIFVEIRVGEKVY